jgi:hypothetical protein
MPRSTSEVAVSAEHPPPSQDATGGFLELRDFFVA